MGPALRYVVLQYTDLIFLAMVLAVGKFYTNLAALIWESFSTMEREHTYMYIYVHLGSNLQYERHLQHQP